MCYEEEQGCASSTQLINEATLAFAGVHMGWVQKQGYGSGKRLICA